MLLEFRQIFRFLLLGRAANNTVSGSSETNRLYPAAAYSMLEGVDSRYRLLPSQLDKNPPLDLRWNEARSPEMPFSGF
jgi:hypothetical protein